MAESKTQSSSETSSEKCVEIAGRRFGNNQPVVVIGGINVLESRELALNTADAFVQATKDLQMPFVFKASFDKANRSAVGSFRGPGLEEGLRILEEVGKTYEVPVVTDIHERSQASAIADVCALIQIPAFLARQTDLLQAVAETGAALHIKKPQFMSPEQVEHVVEKVRSFGNERILLCERGSNFGYDNLVVDMLGFGTMKSRSGGLPVTFDVTHALQQRATGAKASGGRRSQVAELTRAGLGVGLAGLFVEAHPDPDSALCDGPSALPLDKLPQFLRQAKAVDDLVKNLPDLHID